MRETPTQSSSTSFDVYVRWRPVSEDITQLRHSHIHEGRNELITLHHPTKDKWNRQRSWKSGASFADVLEATDQNLTVYERTISPSLSYVLDGGAVNLFAYGHTGSGKTHTIIGYDFEHEEHLGLAFAAAKNLFHYIRSTEYKAIQTINEELLMAVRFFEVRGSSAHDLLKGGNECHVREGHDGRTHIRGQTELLEGGKVRVRPIEAVACPTFEVLKETILRGLAIRKSGSSSVHDESSRTHAILELEIVSQNLINARETLIQRESELVPVGKRATDIYLEEHMASLIKNEDGSYTQNPDRPINQARIDSAEAEKRLFERDVREAQAAIERCLAERKYACLGGKVVFVDLAGAEFFDANPSAKQTAQERSQGRQINKDLFALKEVIRAQASDDTKRIPFRSSPLTMILKSHFSDGSSNDAQRHTKSAMILTVSPEEKMFAATMNTLKYGNQIARKEEGMHKYIQAVPRPWDKQ